jgi:dinuclear metal center YbgI/SA1388 family protein
MTIAETIIPLEKFAPQAYQESYDNCGLITGNAQWHCNGVIVSLDVTVDVVEEAIEKKCNLIVAHHPIIFSGLKKITGKNYVEQTIIKAIKNDIAIYAIHTNLDNVIAGVNKKMAEKIGLINTQILVPKNNLLSKLIVFVPETHAEIVRNSMFEYGAGNISNYSECSFNTIGFGTFKGNDLSNPFLGEKNKRSEEGEIKIEVIFPNYLQNIIVNKMKNAHPYEEVAYDIIPLANDYQQVGSGMIGELEHEISETDFLHLLKKHFNLTAIKHTAFINKKIKKVALCGGSGSFLTKNAIAAQADVYVTSDIKYHEFFDAENKILLTDIGHFESEQFTIDLIVDILQTNSPTFALLKTGVNTNPVKVFI